MRRGGMCLGGEKRGEQEGGHRVEAIAVVPGSGGTRSLRRPNKVGPGRGR